MKSFSKRVLVRLDYNVPYTAKGISDDFRIRATLPTLRALMKKSHQIFIVAHWEQDGDTPHLDLIATRLEKLLHTPVRFVKGALPLPGTHFEDRIILFDNLRLFAGEKENSLSFAKHLASFADYFINDAFSVAHRMHASVVSVPKYLPSVLGPLMKKEIRELSRALVPRHPFFVVLCGKKFSTKAPLIKRFIASADRIFVGGALANTFLQQRGYEIGASQVDTDTIPKKILWHEKVVLPVDVAMTRKGKALTGDLDQIQKKDFIVDIGPKTIALIEDYVGPARLILWNGTFGICEKGFSDGTVAFSRYLQNAKGYSIVGGGDTVAALEKLKYASAPDFLSTGGGAMLDFLAHGTLPGIRAIQRHKK